jgi:hypothetical protein
MRVSVTLISATAEALQSVKQTTDRFALALTGLTQSSPVPEGLMKLFVGLTVAHPLIDRQKRTTARFDKPTNAVYASAVLNYDAWVAPNWKTRVAEVARATADAISAVGKARLTPEERMALLAAVGAAKDQVETDPPDNLVPLSPVYLRNWSPDDATRSISFAAPLSTPFPTHDVIEIPPETASESLQLKIASDDLAMFKLYRNSRRGLEYWEAWYANGKIIEHKGLCGEKGEVREHDAPDAEAARRALTKLKGEGKAAGFKSIAPSRHTMIMIECPINGFGNQRDLECRGKLEDELDNLLGWLGLGHCDGGSTGSDSMEVFCMVVDAKAAIRSINQALAATPDYAGFVARKAER